MKLSLRGRLAAHFLSRAMLLMLALSIAIIVWSVGFVIFILGSPAGSEEETRSPVVVLETIETETEVDEATVTVSADGLELVDEHQGWLQVLDPEGREIFQHARPSTVPTHYAPGELVFLRNRPSEIDQGAVYTWFSSEKGGVTWVFGQERDTLGTAAAEPSLARGLGATGLLLLFGLVAVGGVAWLTGSTLARPMLHIMEWLERLARGDYSEPEDRNGDPASRRADGTGLHKPYDRYREVIVALDTLTGELKDAQRERDRSERAREEWVTGVSHDLRTPLSSVRGYADVLESDYDLSAEEVREYAGVIREQSEYMERLIDDMGLTFRLRAEALPLQCETSDLVELAREATIDLANDPRASGRVVVFEEATLAGGILVSVDPGWLRRALGNLLLNAALHNPPGTHVSVSVRRSGRSGVVQIEDDGRGMDDHTRSRLFDRYYRGTASGDDAGTGLGMAIALQLVQAMSGTLEVDSALGTGTRVRVSMPLVDPDHTSDAS